MSAGSFCMVLHGHLPWVLHHGRWPHGEIWLYEAAAETYLPLLRVVTGGTITVGLMPVLLEQLSSPHFKSGFRRFLAERADRAGHDEAEFAARGDVHLGFLARRWRHHYSDLADQFASIGEDIPRAFAASGIELLTSNATHAYMPLLRHDACARAQVRAGLHTSERILGFRPAGAWLPECAYRPAGPWTPPVLANEPVWRAGVEEIFAHEGVRFFVVDAHLVTGSRSEGVTENGGFRKVEWTQADWDLPRGWRSVLVPHGVSSDGGPARVVAVARHPEVSEQVWSGEVGYPGDAHYLEFHKRHNSDGLRYWKVTGAGTGLGEKQEYHPDDVQGIVYSQAQHFAATVRALLDRHREQTGRPGVVVAPFDAELFGHWWHEGPQFIAEVMRALPGVGVTPRTVSDMLSTATIDTVVTLPEGSWGAGGDHRVWLNDELRWMWQAEYHAEGRFLGMVHGLPWSSRPEVAEALRAAGRELLLLQASDWGFVIHTRGAVDYGYRRFSEHLARFDRACNIADARARGEPDDEVTRSELRDMALHDDCFVDLKLEWWM